MNNTKRTDRKFLNALKPNSLVKVYLANGFVKYGILIRTRPCTIKGKAVEIAELKEAPKSFYDLSEIDYFLEEFRVVFE